MESLKSYLMNKYQKLDGLRLPEPLLVILDPKRFIHSALPINYVSSYSTKNYYDVLFASSDREKHRIVLEKLAKYAKNLDTFKADVQSSRKEAEAFVTKCEGAFQHLKSTEFLHESEVDEYYDNFINLRRYIKQSFL